MRVPLKAFPMAAILVAVFIFSSSASGRTDDQHLGAAAIKNGVVPLQQSATSLLPSNLDALFVDIAKAHWQGCLVYDDAVESPSCTYGNADSETTVVLFGDSKAMQYFSALEPIALQQNWRFVVLTRGNCSWADGHDPATEVCTQWRENTLKRIEDEEKPDLVVLGSSTHYVWNHGADAKDKWMNIYRRQGVQVVQRLKQTGSKVVIMREQSQTKFRERGDTEECIKSNMESLLECAWRPGGRKSRAFDLAIARATKVPAIDVERHVCRPQVCPIVIGNVVVNRDQTHYSASFVETLRPWLQWQLRKAVGKVG